MTNSLLTIHGHTESHVEAVMAEMRTLGAPRIRVVDCGDYYMALEGTHRLEAACRLGIAPDLIVLAQDDLIKADSLDLDCLQAGETYTAGEIAGELYGNGCGAYHIEDDGTLRLKFNGFTVPA